MIETGDEVEHMEKDAAEMANNLNIIIHDISEVLGQMAGGNYAVKSNYSEKYTGDFQKLYESMRGLRDQMIETRSPPSEMSRIRSPPVPVISRKRHRCSQKVQQSRQTP